MRITGGRLRGRRLQAPPGNAVRPTSDRVRQALFNVLAHAAWAGTERLQNEVVLDAFCGSGALGLEAVSHGAARAFFMDTHPAALRAARANAAALGVIERCRFLRTDACNPPGANEAAGLVLLDPPYAKTGDVPDRAARALGSLGVAGWFAPGALIVVETVPGWQPPGGFAVLDARRYGETLITVLNA